MKLQPKPWTYPTTRAFRKFAADADNLPKRIMRASPAQLARANRDLELCVIDGRNEDRLRSRLAVALYGRHLQAEIEHAERQAGWSTCP